MNILGEDTSVLFVLYVHVFFTMGARLLVLIFGDLIVQLNSFIIDI